MTERRAGDRQQFYELPEVSEEALRHSERFRQVANLYPLRATRLAGDWSGRARMSTLILDYELASPSAPIVVTLRRAGSWLFPHVLVRVVDGTPYDDAVVALRRLADELAGLPGYDSECSPRRGPATVSADGTGSAIALSGRSSCPFSPSV